MIDITCFSFPPFFSATYICAPGRLDDTDGFDAPLAGDRSPGARTGRPCFRIGDLESAVRENLLASSALSEQIERFQDELDSKTADYDKTLERIALTRQQIMDILQSDLPRPRKRQLEKPIQLLFQTLEEKKRVEERILKIYDDLLEETRSALKVSLNIKRFLRFSRIAIISVLFVSLLARGGQPDHMDSEKYRHGCHADHGRGYLAKNETGCSRAGA